MSDNAISTAPRYDKTGSEIKMEVHIHEMASIKKPIRKNGNFSSPLISNFVSPKCWYFETNEQQLS